MQILIHSYLYYSLDTSLVSDSVFDTWCVQLVRLQRAYPELSKHVGYYYTFKNFDGCSGYDLNYRAPEIERKALHLLSYF